MMMGVRNIFLLCLLSLLYVKTCTSFQQPVKSFQRLFSSQLAAKFADSSKSKGSSSRSTPSRSRSSNPNKHNPRNDVKKLRFARILRDELSDIICTGDIAAGSYPDEGLLKGVMIVNIDLNSDFSCAKVYLSIFGNAVEKRKVFVWLNENRSKVQHSLRTRLRSMRSVPQISLYLEDTQSSAYLDKVFDEIGMENGLDSTKTRKVEEDDDDFDDFDFEELTN